MKLEEIKKLLTEAVGADQATKVTESLEKFQKTVTEEAQAGVKNLVAEGVKAERIKLEADYLGKLESAKEAGDKTIREEVTKYEKQLAERVKHLLIQAIDSHGDRLARIAEQTEAKRGTALLEEVEKIITKGKAELAETTKADPKALKEASGQGQEPGGSSRCRQEGSPGAQGSCERRRAVVQGTPGVAGSVHQRRRRGDRGHQGQARRRRAPGQQEPGRGHHRG